MLQEVYVTRSHMSGFKTMKHLYERERKNNTLRGRGKQNHVSYRKNTTPPFQSIKNPCIQNSQIDIDATSDVKT